MTEEKLAIMANTRQCAGGALRNNARYQQFGILAGSGKRGSLREAWGGCLRKAVFRNGLRSAFSLFQSRFVEDMKR